MKTIEVSMLEWKMYCYRKQTTCVLYSLLINSMPLGIWKIAKLKWVGVIKVVRNMLEL